MSWAFTSDRAYLDVAGRAFGVVLSRMDRWTPRSAAGFDMWPFAPRTDVVAQALRVGIILAAVGTLSSGHWTPCRMALERELGSHTSPEGAVMFDLSGKHRNTWATIFAWQGTVFAADADEGSLDPIRAAAALI